MLWLVEIISRHNRIMSLSMCRVLTQTANHMVQPCGQTGSTNAELGIITNHSSTGCIVANSDNTHPIVNRFPNIRKCCVHHLACCCADLFHKWCGKHMCRVCFKGPCTHLKPKIDKDYWIRWTNTLVASYLTSHALEHKAQFRCKISPLLYVRIYGKHYMEDKMLLSSMYGI